MGCPAANHPVGAADNTAEPRYAYGRRAAPAAQPEQDDEAAVQRLLEKVLTETLLYRPDRPLEFAGPVPRRALWGYHRDDEGLSQVGQCAADARSISR